MKNNIKNIMLALLGLFFAQQAYGMKKIVGLDCALDLAGMSGFFYEEKTSKQTDKKIEKTDEDEKTNTLKIYPVSSLQFAQDGSCLDIELIERLFSAWFDGWADFSTKKLCEKSVSEMNTFKKLFNKFLNMTWNKEFTRFGKINGKIVSVITLDDSDLKEIGNSQSKAARVLVIANSLENAQNMVNSVVTSEKFASKQFGTKYKYCTTIHDSEFKTYVFSVSKK